MIDSRAARVLWIVALVVPAACGVERGKPAASPSPEAARNVPTSIARVARLAPTLALSGIIAPLQNVAISSPLQEPAAAVFVREGDRVRRGDVLARLDTSDLEASLRSQLAVADADDQKTKQSSYQAQLAYGQSPDTVAQAVAALNQTRESLVDATRDLQRDAVLLRQGFISQQTYDHERTQVLSDEAAVESARATLGSARLSGRVNGTPRSGLQAATVASAAAEARAARVAAEGNRVQIARGTIVSPIDGVVVNRNLNPGELPGTRTLFTVQALARVYADLNASSADVFRLRPGARVRLETTNSPRAHYEGKVVAVLGQVEPGATNFTVKVLVADADGALPAGVAVRASVALPPVRGLALPTTAFVDDRHAAVYVVAGKRVRIAPVVEIASDGTTSLVRGLAPGARVVSDGQVDVAVDERASER